MHCILLLRCIISEYFLFCFLLKSYLNNNIGINVQNKLSSPRCTFIMTHLCNINIIGKNNSNIYTCKIYLHLYLHLHYNDACEKYLFIAAFLFTRIYYK